LPAVHFGSVSLAPLPTLAVDLRRVGLALLPLFAIPLRGCGPVLLPPDPVQLLARERGARGLLRKPGLACGIFPRSPSSFLLLPLQHPRERTLSREPRLDPLPVDRKSTRLNSS